ncbi:MAG: cytochrome b/b6 domain-containing protein [Betaproteobacteria bacterium]|nr:cytochrome b/b6 domain-containing protein [Betaproteobacteria bacterium]
MQTSVRQVPVWDLPLRLFHWTLVLLVAVSAATGLTGGNAMRYHLLSGYAIFALVGFRILWGFAGSTHARFSDFLRGLRTTLRSVRRLFSREPLRYPGHNPLGGWMVVFMLAALAFQAATGLFSNDDIAVEGPLYRLVAQETSDWITGIHKLGSKAVFALVGLHVAAIAFYFVAKGENLVRPMITGRKPWPADVPAPVARFSSPWKALALLLAVAAGIYLLVSKT